MKHGPFFSFVEKTAAMALVIGVAMASPALAASGGGSSSSGGTTPTCKKGTVYSSAQHKCVQSSGSLDDKQLYTQGRDLALAGRYEEALSNLEAISNKNDSMVLTMIGYATRKSGHYDQGLAYYAQALALNPDNVNTHEYLGEAYFEKGKKDLALVELAKIEKVCGTTCEQYEDLSATIAGSTPTWQ